MENQLLANSSALALAETCHGDCDISADNLAVAECVLRILDTGIQKIQIAMLIPMFLADQELLKQCLSKNQMKKCHQYYNEYMRHAELMQETDQKHLHIALIELIDLFCENHNIRDILPDYTSYISSEHKELINALIQLKQVAEIRLKTTAMVEMRREKAIHQIFLDNENTVKSLAKQKKTLHDQEINLRWKLTAKQVLIKKYEEELAVKKWENNLKIKQEILKSSHKIRDFQAKSIVTQERLAEEVEKARTTYEKSLKANMKAEKDIRDEKNKLLLQLQGLIKKYDVNIGDKMNENAELQRVYDEERRKLDEFLIGYQKHEDEYNELAHRKISEENAEFERKLWLFMSTRAAKIIQHYWRKYLKNKKKGEKGGGGGGGGGGGAAKEKGKKGAKKKG